MRQLAWSVRTKQTNKQKEKVINDPKTKKELPAWPFCIFIVLIMSFVANEELDGFLLCFSNISFLLFLFAVTRNQCC